jgi:hypothetical protein
MKKIILAGTFTIFSCTAAFSQTAVDFTANDCAGTSHNLFSDLNAGKVIVIAFVMPCSSCASPALSAYNTVQGYASPDVVFYLADDFGNTSCSTLNNWASTNGMGSAVKFSNAAVTETDYGSGGMPKIIVLGGANHSVFYNENGGANQSGLSPAINSAMLAAGISEKNTADFKLNLFPNPASENISASYSLKEASNVNLVIYNLAGAAVQTISLEKQSAGKHTVKINSEALSSGTYFLKVRSGNDYQTTKFTITK